MRFHERSDWEKTQPQPAGAGADPGGLSALREAGSAFLAAGDAAIDRVLSGDSEKFLQANRQAGGQ